MRTLERRCAVSWQAVKWVFKHSQARPMDRLLLLAIAECADSKGENAWPSVDELARKTGMSKRNVYHAARALVEIGELEVGKGDGGKRNCYRLPMGETRSPLHGETPSPIEGEARSGEPASPVKHVHPDGETPSHKGERVSPDDLYSKPPRTTQEPSVDEPTAQTIVAEWIERCPKRPPGNVVGQVSKQVRIMLEEGVDPDDVRRGMALWMSKGLHPSTIPSVVNEVMNRPAVPAARSTTDERVASTQALKQKFRQQPVAGELER